MLPLATKYSCVLQRESLSAWSKVHRECSKETLARALAVNEYLACEHEPSNICRKHLRRLECWNTVLNNNLVALDHCGHVTLTIRPHHDNTGTFPFARGSLQTFGRHNRNMRSGIYLAVSNDVRCPRQFRFATPPRKGSVIKFEIGEQAMSQSCSQANNSKLAPLPHGGTKK
jgi:hypothetical protein